MKIGSDPERDPERATDRQARHRRPRAFRRRQRRFFGEGGAALRRSEPRGDIRWFEEPVTSDNPPGLRLMRDRTPRRHGRRRRRIYLRPRRRADPARGRSGRRAAGRRDPLRRRLGLSRRSAPCARRITSISPAIAPPPCTGMSPAPCRALRHLEWFHDHVRIEHMLFDGAPTRRGRRDPPGPRPAGSWARVQGQGRRTLPGGRGRMKPLLRNDPAVHEAVVTASKRLDEALATLKTYMPSETARSEAGRRESPIVRTVHAGVAILSLSVLADSAVEHYRGSFQNKAMFAPLIGATLTLAAGDHGRARGPRAARPARRRLRRGGGDRPRRALLPRLQHRQAARAAFPGSTSSTRRRSARRWRWPWPDSSAAAR